jgi:hypothetical protein
MHTFSVSQSIHVKFVSSLLQVLDRDKVSLRYQIWELAELVDTLRDEGGPW